MEHGELFILEVSGSIIGSAFVEPVTPNYAAFTLMPGLACTASFLKRTSKSRFSSGTYHRPKRVLSIEILEKRRN